MSKNDINGNLILESGTLKGCLSSQVEKGTNKKRIEKKNYVSSYPSKNRPNFFKYPCQSGT